jgi:hypothetical protein
MKIAKEPRRRSTVQLLSGLVTPRRAETIVFAVLLAALLGLSLSWSQGWLPPEAVAAVLGALAGGVITGSVALWQGAKDAETARDQLERTLDAQTRARIDSAAEERRASALAMHRSVGWELLETIHSVEQTLALLPLPPHFRVGLRSSPQAEERHEAGIEALRAMRRAERVLAPLMPEPLPGRIRALAILVLELSTAQPAADRIGADGWQPEILQRARDDIAAYAVYVERSLVAVMTEGDMPADTPSPNLRRPAEVE